MTFLGIIPARWSSSRFPGKPLALINGIPMIRRVYERASQALGEGNVVVATDDVRILDCVHAFGGKAVMTSTDHQSGTDRCLEAYDKSGSRADVIINIQGDEPFIDPRQILSLRHCFDDPAVEIATLVRPFDASLGYEALANPSTPKVILSAKGDALWFSRAVIPVVRGTDVAEWPAKTPYFTHVGLYAYRAETLRKITALPRSQAEIAESLEQLRWLQNGFAIRTAPTTIPTISIDTPDDLRRAEEYLNQQGLS